MKVRVRRVPLLAALMLVSVMFAAPRSFATPTSGASVAAAASPIEYTLLPDGSWTALDIRSTFGGAFINGAVPFVDPVTGFQTVYGVNPSIPGGAGDLLEYTRLPAGNWISLDISATFGALHALPVVQPFVDPLTNLQNVYATDGGSLIEYTRLPAGNWISLDITRTFNLPPVVGPIPFVDPVTQLQNVYGLDPATMGLTEFTRLPAGNWVALEITRAFNTSGLDNRGFQVPITDPVSNNQIVLGIASTHVIQWARNPDGSWASVDLTAVFHLTGAQSLVPVVDPTTHGLTMYASVGDQVFGFARLADSSWVQENITATFSLLPGGFATAPFIGGGLLKLFTFGAGGDFEVYKRAADGSWTSADLTTLFHVPALVGASTIFPIVDPVTKFLNVYGDQTAVVVAQF